ncbi:MAG: hypothetical protein NVS4B9_14620 [Ktedonobacteraceae bacterium]
MKQLGQIAIGRYQLQRHLARGGMADIYLAHDIERDQTVAIKMVHESAGEYCERFQREVKVMAGLAHEHILPAFDYGEFESWYFLVTPYIEYGTLSSRLANGPLTLEETDTILAQLAGALQFAHEQGIVHRDIKPSNILMHDGEHVYLADFGLVKRVGQENGLTVTGYLIGTPEYMAPELADEDASPQSDVYALGVLLYQMLAGRVPFKANTPMGVYLRHIRDNPELPSTFNPAIPAQVESVIMHAIEKDPRQRYQSVWELYTAYQQAVKNVAHEQAMVANQAMQTPIIQMPRADIKIVKQSARDGRPLLMAMVLVAALLAGSIIMFNFVLPSWGEGSNIHAADRHGHIPANSPTPANTSGRKAPGSYIESTVSSKQPKTGSSAQNTTILSNQSLQNINNTNASGTSNNSPGGAGNGDETAGGQGGGNNTSAGDSSGQDNSNKGSSSTSKQSGGGGNGGGNSKSGRGESSWHGGGGGGGSGNGNGNGGDGNGNGGDGNGQGGGGGD